MAFDVDGLARPRCGSRMRVSAESCLTGGGFRQILGRIERLERHQT